MSNLVSMKVDTDSCVPCPSEAYGYGLRICLNDEQCKALGVQGPVSAGTVMGLHARVVVVSCKDEIDNAESTERETYLDLQITDLALAPPPASAQSMYPNSKMEE